uniref:Uncharacterized protein n=1 Tax=Vitis vinifera TaxID=29760 RepID=A5AZ46_VITVI|nr:hypothetical protein VITISV_029691 [Vitis vinifera]
MIRCDVHDCRIAWRRVSSWGIRMELSRIAWRRMSYLGNLDGVEPNGSLHLTHADDPPCDVWISHPELCPACPDLLIALIRRASVINISDYPDFAQCRGVLLKLHDIFDQHFGIFCFRYLISKSPKSPCNPPIIGFLSL